MKNKETYKTEATIGTFTIFSLLFVFLFVLGFSRCANEEIEDLDESGVTVNLGEQDYGGQEEVPIETETMEEFEENPVTEEVQTLSQDAEAPEVQQTASDKKTNEERPSPPVEETKPTEKPIERKPNQRSLFNAPKQGSGFGSGTKSGNQGELNGEVGGKPDGMGQGNAGNSSGRYTLAGRKPEYIEEPNTNLSQDCKVVVEVKVDPDGNVLKAVATPLGYCSTPSLLRAAEKAALKWKFSKRIDSKNNQFGTITFKYKRG